MDVWISGPEIFRDRQTLPPSYNSHIGALRLPSGSGLPNQLRIPNLAAYNGFNSFPRTGWVPDKPTEDMLRRRVERPRRKFPWWLCILSSDVHSYVNGLPSFGITVGSPAPSGSAPVNSRQNACSSKITPYPSSPRRLKSRNISRESSESGNCYQHVIPSIKPVQQLPTFGPDRRIIRWFCQPLVFPALHPHDI